MLTNGRMPESVSESFRAQFGTAPTEDLDHAIAAELGGSNDPANLHNVPSSKNRGQFATLENKLAKAVIGGQMSYVDAARQDLAQKGMSLKEDSAKNTPVNSFLLNTPSVLKPLAAVQNGVTATINAVKAAPKAWFDFVSSAVEKSPLVRFISDSQIHGIAQGIHDAFTSPMATSGITNPKDKNYKAFAGSPQALNADDINAIISTRAQLIQSGVPREQATIQASQQVRSKKATDLLTNAVAGTVGGEGGDISAIDMEIARETDPKKLAQLVTQREALTGPTMAKEQIPKFSDALSSVSSEAGVRNAFKRNSIQFGVDTAHASAGEGASALETSASAEVPKPPAQIESTIPKELQPLADEAKKYGSADEFINAVTKDKGGVGNGVEYSPAKRLVETPLNDTPLTNFGFKPDDMVTIYRGVDRATQKDIAPGDYIATSYDLAKSYTGSEGVISKEVPASSVRFASDDGIESDAFKKGFNETHLEGVYNPTTPIPESQLSDFYDRATKSTTPIEAKGPKSFLNNPDLVAKLKEDTQSIREELASSETGDGEGLDRSSLRERTDAANPTETAQKAAQDTEKERVQLPATKPPEIRRSFMESIPTSDMPVKSKVNIVDYLRTPEDVLKKMGLGNEMGKLRAGYEAYRQELTRQLTYLRGLAERAPGEETAQKIFKYLDGQSDVVLTPEQQRVTNEIKAYLRTWADRLGLPKDRRITNYITHIFEPGLIQKEFDPELAKIIDARVPGSVYDPFVENRIGKLGYKENVWQALDAYVKRGVRKVNMDPALKSLEAASNELDLESYKYVARFAAGVNMRPTEIDNLLDNFIKQTPIGYKLGQRPTLVITRAWRNMIARGALGFNLGSALKNLTQGVNTYAELGERYTLTGYIKMLMNGTDELFGQGILGEDLIQDKHVGVLKSVGQKLDNALFYPFEVAETINRGAAYYGAKAKALAAGSDMQTAIDYAKGVVRKTQFQFGSLDTPVALQSDIAKTFAQLQTYNVKQGEFLINKIKAKDFAGLVRWTAGTIATIYSVGKLLGMTWEDILPSFRIGGSPLGTAVSGVTQSLSGNPQTKAEGQKNLQSLPWLIVPAGSQIKKTYTGLSDVMQGSSKTASGKTRYKIGDNATNLIRAGLFGPQGLSETQDYYGNAGSTPSKAKSSSSKNRFSL